MEFLNLDIMMYHNNLYINIQKKNIFRIYVRRFFIFNIKLQSIMQYLNYFIIYVKNIKLY